MSELTAVLKDCLPFVRASENSAYAGMEVSEIVQLLQDAIAQLEKGGSIDKEGLDQLFLPTGDLQETAIDNDWGDEYLALAARFDNAI